MSKRRHAARGRAAYAGACCTEGSICSSSICSSKGDTYHLPPSSPPRVVPAAITAKFYLPQWLGNSKRESRTDYSACVRENVREAPIVFAGDGDKMLFHKHGGGTEGSQAKVPAHFPSNRLHPGSFGCGGEHLAKRQGVTQQGVDEVSTKPTPSRLQLSTSSGKLRDGKVVSTPLASPHRFFPKEVQRFDQNCGPRLLVHFGTTGVCVVKSIAHGRCLSIVDLDTQTKAIYVCISRCVFLKTFLERRNTIGGAKRNVEVTYPLGGADDSRGCK